MRHKRDGKSQEKRRQPTRQGPTAYKLSELFARKRKFVLDAFEKLLHGLGVQPKSLCSRLKTHKIRRRQPRFDNPISYWPTARRTQNLNQRRNCYISSLLYRRRESKESAWKTRGLPSLRGPETERGHSALQRAAAATAPLRRGPGSQMR